jgi:hypothetical protein
MKSASNPLSLGMFETSWGVKKVFLGIFGIFFRDLRQR